MKRFYTLWIAGVILVLFFLQVFVNGFTEVFVLNEKAVYNYEIWRFLTAIFLHGSLSHLLFNLFAFVFFGLVAENILGSKKFLVLFFLSGVIANLVSINFYKSSLGASGAIMGIIGFLALIRPFMMVWAFGVMLPLFLAAIFWIIGDLIGIFYPTGVGNIAHLTGVAVGVLVGLFLKLFNQEKIRNRKKGIDLSEDLVRRWERNYLKD